MPRRAAPSFSTNADAVKLLAKFERLSASPGTAKAFMLLNRQIDVTSILPNVRVPTLVLHRRTDAMVPVERGRELAALIPGAKYIEYAHTADLLARLPKSKPIVAAVHGVVMGLAIGVAFECDLVVADSQTRFQIIETPRGLGGARFWALLHFCAGGSFATEVALTGRFFFGRGSGRGGDRRFYCSARFGRRDSYSSSPPDRSQSASKRTSNRTSTPLVHGSS